MRKRLQSILPDADSVRRNRWLRPFASTLLHPRLWHLNRHSAAGAVAVGLFCGLIPGPFQMLGAAIMCVLFRVNLPLALFTTLYTNPLTIIPLYIVAYRFGAWVLAEDAGNFSPPPELEGADLISWVAALIDWTLGLGKPLALGLVMLAATLSLGGYLAVRWGWRLWLVREWRKRKHQRTHQR